MKNKLLPLLFVLGSYSAYSQAVIGKQEVNPSVQLEVFANDKGILIPRVTLTGSTDATTITSGNVNSLLVFNTTNGSDVKPGYYYWFDNKWLRLAVSEEITGTSIVVVGEGVPGAKGQPGYPGEGVNLYTDKNSGIVYVQNADGTWSSINGKNGIDGKNGIAGGSGVPGTGTAGIDGTIQMYIDYTTGIVYVRDPQDGTKWVPLNGPAGNNGKDGMTGGTGAPGTPGAAGITKDSTIYVDNTTGTVYILTPGTDPLDPKNWIPINGLSGNNGKDGMTGGTGAPGTPGAAGITKDSTIYVDNSTGTVYILTPGTDPLDPKNWIPINGKDGLDGKNGILGGDGLPGPKGLDGTIQMYIDYTTGIVYVRDPQDSTKWVPLNGPAGNNGKDGMTGGTGAPGTPGAAGITKDSTIYVDNTTGTVYILTPGTDPLDPKNWIPINGLSGNNGKDGMTGGTGAPGTPGAAGISKDSTIYVDNSTGTVYILTPGTDPLDPKNWIPINGKDGLDGKNGILGGDGLPGPKGLDGTIQMYIDYTTGIVYVRDPQDSTNWVPLNGPAGNNGKDGMTGGTGAPGTPGAAGITKDSTIYVDNSTGIVYILTPGTDPLDPKNWIPINGLSGNNGKDGMTGGTGAPGTPGAAGISKDSTIYVDNSTGTVYILTPGTDPLDPKNWIPINGKDGLDGKNGILGGDGLPGPKGLDGTIQMYIDYTTGIVYVRDPQDSTNWIPLNGPAGNNGKDGMTGGTGAPGTPGAAGITKDSTIYVDNTTGTVYILTPGTDPLDPKNWIPINGLSGNNGKDGMTGGTGAPGTPGAAGISKDSTIYVDNSTGTVYILTPGTDPLDPKNWIPINGKDGLDGKNGILGGDGLPGPKGLDGTIQMYIDYTTGIVYVRDPQDSTNWVPLNGPAGNNGKDGMTGGTGAPGTPGAAGITKDSTIYVDNTTGTVYILTPGTDPLDPKNWIPVNGKNGLDGKNGISGGSGVPGAPGTPGIDGTIEMYVDYSTGIVYVRDPKDNTKWVRISGRDGVDGATGLAGGPGIPGKNGVDAPPSTTTWIDTTTGIVYIKDTITGEWVKVSGNDGADGKSAYDLWKELPGNDGKSLTEYLDGLKGAKGDTGAAFIFSDFTPEQLAGLTGATGETGAIGLTGATGVTGADGTTSFVPTVTDGHDIATYTDASGNPASIKETVTSLTDIVTSETDEYGQLFDKHTLTYKDEAGTSNPIDLSVLVKGTETLTSLTYDGAKQELVYKDEKGVESSFTMTDLVGPAQTVTKLEVNHDQGTLDYTDENKDTHALDLTDVVKEPWYSVATNKGATLNTDNVYTQGWVGIGFTTPSNAIGEKLRVNGSITTVGSYYADYVFEDYFNGFSDIKADYKFKPLAEVDAYIKKNKHLPGITPINELVKTKEGYSFNMSELSIQLLEKTEEIYLHVIEQNKVNESQSLEIESQRKEIELKDREIKELKAASELMNLRLEKLEKLIQK